MPDVQDQILKESIDAFRQGWGEPLPEDLEASVTKSFKDFITTVATSLEGQDVTLAEKWEKDRSDVLEWIRYKAEKTRSADKGSPTVSYGDLSLARNGIGDTDWC